jgi:hypothetical protein
LISFTVQHILILRLLIKFRFPSARAMHNLLFLVSAEKPDSQHLGFYDFVRTGFGAHSSGVQKILDELKREKLIDTGDDGIKVTAKGQAIYSNLAASLTAFTAFCELCEDMVNRHGGDPQALNRAVFCHLQFRRTRMGARLFSC